MLSIFRDIFRGFFVGILLFLILQIIKFSNGGVISVDQHLLNQFIITQVYTIVLFVVNARFFRWLFHFKRDRIHPYYLLLLHGVGSVILSFSSVFAINVIMKAVVKGRSVTEFLLDENFKNYLLPLGIVLLISVIVSGFHLYKNKQESKVKEQKVIAGHATAQFDALKNQLDPHFLFNSLNVLTSLIEENPEAAQKFTTLLSKVYRYVLEQKSKEVVSVEEELNFAEIYMKLILMRFEKGIVFTVEGSIDQQAKVVPLSLQLLLENAVKHNQITKEKPLIIKIIQQNDYLVISNNYQPKSVIKTNSGVGLFNIKQRYSLLTSRSVTIEKSDTEFRVRIPLLTKQLKMEHIQENFIKDKRYQLAKNKLEELKGFYGNLTAYLIVIPFLAWLNYMTSAGFPWIIFPTLGWGLGVLFHAMEVYNYNPFFGKRWEERKIRELMNDEPQKKL